MAAEQPSTSSAQTKEQKKKDRAKSKNHVVAANTDAAEMAGEKKDRKSKKSKGKEVESAEAVQDGLSNGESSEVKSRKEKKEKKKRKESAADVNSDTVDDTSSKEKKKKRKREERAEEESEVQDAEGESSGPKKKKSRNKTGLPDPEEEALLSEQALKALVYAFTQFRRPSKWKFHKARQNWIIRNIWSSENIPDSQLPLVLRYLSNVQGKVRENLTKTCESILTQPVAEPSTAAPVPSTTATEATEQPVEQTQEPQKDDITKRSRAEALLAVLKDSEASVTAR